MVDFAGWDMPVQYSSITEEHTAVRTACGLFDVSHMGRVVFRGPDAQRFLDHVLTNDCTRIPAGRIRYALVCHEAGGVLDDVLVYNLGHGEWQLVVNASNREKLLDWFAGQAESFDVEIDDLTTTTFMLALQGPRAVEITEAALPAPESDDAETAGGLAYYSFLRAKVGDSTLFVSRTGYTGEDGVEIVGPTGHWEAILNEVLCVGEPLGLAPAGLGCRDTLRLEAGMPLYGHELTEEIDPLTAGLAFAVKLDAGDFVGRDALRKVRDKGPTRRRVGLELEGRRIAREHVALFAPGGERPIGEVTSGTFSPTLEKSIAMAYVDEPHAVGSTIEVDLRGKRLPATIVQLPFYKRP